MADASVCGGSPSGRPSAPAFSKDRWFTIDGDLDFVPQHREYTPRPPSPDPEPPVDGTPATRASGSLEVAQARARFEEMSTLALFAYLEDNGVQSHRATLLQLCVEHSLGVNGGGPAQ